MSADVEVCIVSYDSVDAIADALGHLERAVPGATVAIREHGHDPIAADRLRRLVDAHTSPIRLEFDPANPGFGAGCNALASTSGAGWLLFLNPDANVVAWPWTADDPPPRGTIVGPLLTGNGPSERHVGTSFSVRDEIARSWLRRVGTRPVGSGFVSGAALLIDRPSFERIGGFDEDYFMFYEDIELCLRANRAGIGTVVDDRWIVDHEGGHSTSKRWGDALVWSYESACRFHGSTGSSVTAYRTYVVADSVLRSLWHRARGRRTRSSEYLGLARRAAADLRRSIPSRRR